jgi:hypothetical protein
VRPGQVEAYYERNRERKLAYMAERNAALRATGGTGVVANDGDRSTRLEPGGVRLEVRKRGMLVVRADRARECVRAELPVRLRTGLTAALHGKQ